MSNVSNCSVWHKRCCSWWWYHREISILFASVGWFSFSLVLWTETLLIWVCLTAQPQMERHLLPLLLHGDLILSPFCPSSLQPWRTLMYCWRGRGQRASAAHPGTTTPPCWTRAPTAASLTTTQSRMLLPQRSVRQLKLWAPRSRAPFKVSSMDEK